MTKTIKTVTKLEVDLLLLFYNLSDQFGVVDIKNASIWAKRRMGVDIPLVPFVMTQQHYDFLMDREAIPDTRALMKRITSPKPPRNEAIPP